MDSVNPEASQKALKSRLRKKIREQRRNIRDRERLALDSAINRFLATYIDQFHVRTIAAFWPFDGEPDLLPALHRLERQGIQLALPVIRKASASPSMIFGHWTIGATMEPNHFGIPEPVGTDEILLPDIDLMLLPLVGWDQSGGRLGMGAGYYDRALQPFTNSNAPIRMGVAYQLQKLPLIPAEPWDIRLHVILSESGWAICHEG